MNENNDNGENPDNKVSDNEGENSDECPQLISADEGSSLINGLNVNRFVELRDKVSENTLKAIKDMEFTQMTEIQAKTIPHLLEGK